MLHDVKSSRARSKACMRRQWPWLLLYLCIAASEPCWESLWLGLGTCSAQESRRSAQAVTGQKLALVLHD